MTEIREACKLCVAFIGASEDESRVFPGVCVNPAGPIGQIDGNKSSMDNNLGTVRALGQCFLEKKGDQP